MRYGHPIVSHGSQHVTLHVPLTPETKVSIEKEQLMKMPKRATLIKAACPERAHEARGACVSKCENRLFPLRCASA